MLATGVDPAHCKPASKGSLSPTHGSPARRFPALPALLHPRSHLPICSAPVSPRHSPPTSRPVSPRVPQREMLLVVDGSPPPPLGPLPRSKPIPIPAGSHPSRPSQLSRSVVQETPSHQDTPRVEGPLLSSLPNHLPSALSSRDREESPFFAPPATGRGPTRSSAAATGIKRPVTGRQATPTVRPPGTIGREGGKAKLRVGGWIAM